MGSSAGSSCWEPPGLSPLGVVNMPLSGMEDPTWFWGGVQPWKPTPRHISSKRCGPLGHKYVQPTWETTYGKTYRKPTTTSTTQYFTKSTRYIPREKLRICEVERQPPRPKLYHQQYS